MRSQSIFLPAVVAFATTSYAPTISSELVEREPTPEGARAAFVVAGKEFAERDIADAASLLSAAESKHNSQTYDVSDSASLLAATEAKHQARRVDDAISLLAAAAASHNNKRSTDETDPSALLAAAEANHQSRDVSLNETDPTPLLAAATSNHQGEPS